MLLYHSRNSELDGAADLSQGDFRVATQATYSRHWPFAGKIPLLTLPIDELVETELS